MLDSPCGGHSIPTACGTACEPLPKILTPMDKLTLLRPALALMLGATMIQAAPVAAPLLESAAGWKQAGPGKFTLKDGVAVAEGGMGMFWNPAKQYRNFTLKLQFSWDDPKWNSGVFIRFPDPGSDPGVAIKDGYEVQVSGSEANQTGTGSIYDIQAPSHIPLRKDKEWNDLEITAVGPWIAVVLNGELINLFRAHAGRGDVAGFIGLQNHDDSSATRYQKISVVEWPDDASFTEVFADAGYSRGLLASYHARLSVKDTPWYDKMDMGPAFYQTFGDYYNGKYRSDALKGVVLRPSPNPNFVVLFDTEAGKLVTASDKGLNLKNTPWAAKHGNQNEVNNKESFLFATTSGPGWATADGKFADKRVIKGHGNYPHIVFNGHHRHGSQVVLNYSVHGAGVLESVSLEHSQGVEALARTLNISANKAELLLHVASNQGSWEVSADQRSATAKGDHQTAIALTGAATAKLSVEGDNLVARFPAAQATAVKILISAEKADAFAKSVAKWPAARSLAEWIKPGVGLYPERFETKGELATGSDPWLVDSVTLPPSQNGNPYQAGIRFGAFDFFADGDRAALSTWEGDVWIVSGLKGDWSKLTWNRFATGLFEPLGLKIVGDVIYVNGRDQLLTLHDLNNDGETDDYRTFNRDVIITNSFHEFAFDLQTDKAGNFYFAKGGPVKSGGRGFSEVVPHNGVVARVSKDGKKFDVIATGLRAPGGIGVGPNGEITTGENEGTWVPACKLNYFQPGAKPVFLGVEGTRQKVDSPMQEPLCYLPMNVDNSGGGQVWVPAGSKFGLQPGELIHLSYGQSSLYRVLKQEIGGGQMQGGVVRIPLDIKSSAQRSRFHPDGSAYLLGFRGWQTNAATDCAFHRIRFNDKPILIPNKLEVVPGGIRIGFEVALDKDLAEDPKSYSIERWKYIYCKQYGSGEFSIDKPDAQREKNALEKESKGSEPVHDKVEVAAAHLLPDGKSVMLDIPTLKPAMQMKLGYDLETADGKEAIGAIYSTIHQVPAK